MKPKSLLLLALAGGCGLVASIGISQVMDSNRQGGAALDTAPIYVALHNINLGDPIDPTMVTLMEWPKDRIPPGAISTLEDLEGRRPRSAIIEGEPILGAKLLESGAMHDPIAQLPKGYRLSTIAVDAQKSAAGLLSPGDRVDVQLFVNRNERAGITEPMTKVILQNIRVYAVESAVQRSADGGEARTIPKTVSLVVTPKQAAEIDLARNLGNLSLIPRNPNDEKATAAVEVNAGSLLGNDVGNRNTREQEQNRDDDEDDEKKGGLISGFMSLMNNAAKARPPFEMELLRGEEVEVVKFNPSTGKPLRPAGGNGGSTNEYGVPMAPQANSTPTPAAGSDVDFPIDFGDDS
ncbi:MAG: Flp pilus assembly protein CpaB [Planctomycetota bacterium]